MKNSYSQVFWIKHKSYCLVTNNSRIGDNLVCYDKVFIIN